MERFIHIIGSCVVEEEGKVLLVQEAKEVFPGVKGKWNLPTGKIELKEDPETCSIRETKEETGLDVELDYLIGIYKYYLEIPPEGKLVDVLRFAYKAHSTGGELGKTDEVSECKWFSLDEIEKMHEEGKLRSAEVHLVIKDYFGGKKLPLETLTVVKK